MPPTLVRASPVETLTDQAPACAFLFESGTVKQVFTSNEAARTVAQRPGVQTIERPEQCVLPGFCDAHVHLRWLGESLREPDVSDCSSYRELRRCLVEFIEANSPTPGTLIRGRGWNPDMLCGGDWPHWSNLKHETLDDYPIALMSHDHHACWINQRLLQRLPLSRSAANRKRVISDENGDLAGVFLERAMEPITDLIDTIREDQDTSELLHDAMAELVRNGIVCAHDIGHADSFTAHRKIREDQDCLPDILFFCFQGSWEDLTVQQEMPDPEADGLELAGMKLFADGTLGARTAAMFEPYQEPARNQGSPRGDLIHDQQELKSYASQAAEKNYATAIHAIGDRAVHISLNVLSEVYDDGNNPAYPPRVEHAEFVSPSDIDRFGANDIVASLQPCHLFQDAETAPSRVGNRANRMIPSNSLLEADAPILFGSDAPIESLNPLRNLEAAVNRSSLPAPLSYDESVSVKQALLHTCQMPARYLNHSGNRGKIEPGFPASFVTLSDHPSNYSGSLTDIRVQETYIQGSRVYSSDSS